MYVNQSVSQAICVWISFLIVLIKFKYICMDISSITKTLSMLNLNSTFIRFCDLYRQPVLPTLEFTVAYTQ